ncbi:MAG TPA: PDZ domain-containing protein [Nitriliruptorales bacterium]|nr:PDZ domain-containing protein [Nitriliruptorales bacterium]
MDQPIRYAVDLSRRLQHLVTVRMTVPVDLASGARLVLPVWTPGSYLLRHYVHHLQRVSARAGDQAVPLRADGNSAWRLPDDVRHPVVIELELYANELTVRTNHVDDHHMLLVPPATFPYVDGARDRRHEVTVGAPQAWRVWGLLPRQGDTFVATDYDHLADSAFEAGAHPEVSFDVAGVPHLFVWAGHAGRPDLDRIASDAQAVCAVAVDLFGGDLPVERYTFLCTAWDQGGGGLEHRDGAVLQLPAHSLHDPDGYRRLLSLLVHEYLHLWNVKRLTPAALTALDYERPIHTPSLWVVEGWTAYYDGLLPLRAGLTTTDRYLRSVGELVRRVLDRPGRVLQSLRQASHEAWVKFYMRDENTPNAGISYYDHGAVLAWCLDLLVRRARPDSDGLDEVVRRLWTRFGTTGEGYEESDVEAAASAVAGTDLGGFFADHVAGVDPPPVDELVGIVGLRFVAGQTQDQPAAPDLGVEIAEDDDGIRLVAVLRDRPAWTAGLTGGDRLLAVDGARVRRGELRKALLAHAPGDPVDVTVFRGPRLVTTTVTLGPPRADRHLRSVEEPTDRQQAAFQRWTGRSLPSGDTPPTDAAP